MLALKESQSDLEKLTKSKTGEKVIVTKQPTQARRMPKWVDNVLLIRIRFRKTLMPLFLLIVLIAL
jgi:hypothetical protein